MIEFVKNNRFKVKTPTGFEEFSGIRRTTKSKVLSIVFADGVMLKCSLDHRFVCEGGEVLARELKLGDYLSNTVEILSIEEGDNDSYLYDLTDVGGGSLYITDGIVSHNCDFASSGATVILPDILKEYAETIVADPIERRGIDRSLWIWEYAAPLKYYMLVADVARGDGADYSAFHVIDTETLTQVAEYQAQIDTREYANVILSTAAEYNNALVVVENANIGWDVLQTISERGYTNVYYSHKVDNASFDEYINKYNRGDGLVPGFSTTQKTRPLIVERLRDLIETKSVTIKSERLIEELRCFIWKNGKAQAMQGRNDDLVMSFAIAMYLRESSLRYKATADNLTYAALNGMTRTGADRPVYNLEKYGSNPWSMDISAGTEQQAIDITWLI